MKKKRGRRVGWRTARPRKKDTITLYPEDWKTLDSIGPSRGKAVQKLIQTYRNDNASK